MNDWNFYDDFHSLTYRKSTDTGTFVFKYNLQYRYALFNLETLQNEVLAQSWVKHIDSEPNFSGKPYEPLRKPQKVLSVLTSLFQDCLNLGILIQTEKSLQPFLSDYSPQNPYLSCQGLSVQVRLDDSKDYLFSVQTLQTMCEQINSLISSIKSSIR